MDPNYYIKNIQNENKPIVFLMIGGPGSGKSTTARLLAEKLNFIYLDTGAMYRAVTFYFLKNSVNLKDSKKIYEALLEINLSIHFYDKFEIYISDKNVDKDIRSTKVNEFVSFVSQIELVRKKMVEIQRSQSIMRRYRAFLLQQNWSSINAIIRPKN